MSVLILDSKLNGEAVRVTAADYNGSFDGNPFSMGPEWLIEAIIAKKITVVPNDRDYACWKVLTPKGEIIAEPDDIIMYQPSIGLTVYSLLIPKTR